jgi:hypothetical protein
MTAARLSAHMTGMETTQPSDTPIAAGHVIERLALAQNPNTEAQTLWQLIDDRHTTVANTARHRLNLALRPLEAVHIPVIDPATGLVVKP